MRITEAVLGQWGCRVSMSLLALPIAAACDPGESAMPGAGLGPSLAAGPRLVAGDGQNYVDDLADDGLLCAP